MSSVLVLAALVNALVVGVLVLLLFWIRRMIRALRSAVDDAVLRRAEYERALADYRHLMRHRIANPLTAVRGGLQSLRELPDLSRDERQQLLETVQDAARRLERVALDPAPRSTEEQQLEARPRLRRRSAA